MLSTSLLVSGRSCAFAFALAPGARRRQRSPARGRRRHPGDALLRRQGGADRAARAPSSVRAGGGGRGGRDPRSSTPSRLPGRSPDSGRSASREAVPVGALASMIAAWCLQSFARRPILRLEPATSDARASEPRYRRAGGQRRAGSRLRGGDHRGRRHRIGRVLHDGEAPLLVPDRAHQARSRGSRFRHSHAAAASGRVAPPAPPSTRRSSPACRWRWSPERCSR